MEYNVIFQPSGRRGKVTGGKTILQASHDLGVDIESVCGASKVCGKCKVKIEEGYFQKFGIESRVSHLSPLTSQEEKYMESKEIKENYRFACATEIHGDILVFVPEESRGAQQIVLETGKERVFIIDPAVRKYYVELDPATLEDHRGDFERLCMGLRAKYPQLPENLAIDYFLLQKLPPVLRSEKWKVTVTIWQSREIINVEAGFNEKIVGVGIDIGTTTLAAYLCDLRTGKVLSKKSMMNPQVRYGEDVLSRISYAMMEDNGLEKMHNTIIESINILIGKMTAEVGLIPQDLQEVVLVFNTVMHHIALNIDPKFMGRSPFAPAIKHSLDIKARDLKIEVNPSANVHVLPIEAGFVGADNVAVLIAEEPYNQEEMRLIIDIGTNGEIDVGNKNQMLSTSCATGPALEGAQIKFGMRAAPGAIECIQIDTETLEPRYKVIGSDVWYPENRNPGAKGLCGSGIIDAIAELFKAGIIGTSGRFNGGMEAFPRVRKGADGKMEYVICWASETSIDQDISITISDVRAVQLAKSALYVGAKYLMEKLGIEKIDSVTLAGAFGSYINRESALLIGMFPDCNLERVTAVGNAAGDGAQIALLNKEKRVEADRVAREVYFVETAVESDFQKRFSDAMAFPHSHDLFPSIQHILDQIPKRGKRLTAR
ncbi:Na(+)-translocating NADH-quinone reductase subunit F [Peptococcaceae bacterium CEB3]|nr:Na(+)-translocating NADH-quinone reductase subunit F [Peptococcaceae bacterium CEB3]